MGWWQGNPELVWHRERLVSNSLRLAHLEGQDLEYAQVPEAAKARMDAMYRADGKMICQLCGISYNRHPGYPYAVDADGGGTHLNELCNGDLIHL